MFQRLALRMLTVVALVVPSVVTVQGAASAAESPVSESVGETQAVRLVPAPGCIERNARVQGKVYLYSTCTQHLNVYARFECSGVTADYFKRVYTYEGVWIDAGGSCEFRSLWEVRGGA